MSIFLKKIYFFAKLSTSLLLLIIVFLLIFLFSKSYLKQDDPLKSSLKTAVGKISPEDIFGNHYFFCSSVTPSLINSAAISALVPIDPIPM